MARRWSFFALGWALVLGGALIAHLVQTSSGVKVEDVRYAGRAGETLSGLLYVPPSATPQHPAPAVLVSHGFINTREMQSPFAIELSRRGFVALAMDMTGHGYSAGPMGIDGFGGPASLAYLRRLPFVDPANIGLEGHSMGGAPVMNAATAFPDGYRAIVLEGSTTQFFGAGAPATPSFPRNLAVVFGRYDEFAPLMWGRSKGADVGSSPKLEAIFGTSRPVVPGRLYGDVAAGTGRLLVIPLVDHPQEHFSSAGVGAAVDWFQRTLRGAARPAPPSDQIWFGKEIGTLVSFVGAVVLMLATFELALATPAFSPLAQSPEGGADGRRLRWALAFLLTAAVPALTFYPFMKWAPAIFFGPFAAAHAMPAALAAFPAQIVDQLVVWAVLTGLVGLVLSLAFRSGRPAFSHRRLRAAGAAASSVGMAYLALLVVDALFKTDFRFWVLGLKPLDTTRFGLFLAYLVPFTLFALMAFRGYAVSLPVKGESTATALAAGALAFSGGFIVLLAAQYLAMARTGLLLTPDEPLNTIIAFQFVPVLAVIGLIAAFAWRRTGDYVPGAFICALFLTWYVVSGTAIFPPTLAALAPPRAAPRAGAPNPAPPADVQPGRAKGP
jgi:pimeloyl-ACP methyl ester carboxylesterase